MLQQKALLNSGLYFIGLQELQRQQFQEETNDS